MLGEDFKYYFKKAGLPIEKQTLSSEEIEYVYSTLPKELADLMAEIGRFSWAKGIVQVCHPSDFANILDLVFKKDKQFDSSKCHPFLYSVFGKLYFWIDNTGIGYIDFLYGFVLCRGITEGIRPGAQIERAIHVPFANEIFAYDVLDMDGKPLFARACKKLGVPSIGQCFGFAPILVFGGERNLESLRLYEAKTHFSILAQATTFKLVHSTSPTKIEVLRIMG